MSGGQSVTEVKQKAYPKFTYQHPNYTLELQAGSEEKNQTGYVKLTPSEELTGAPQERQLMKTIATSGGHIYSVDTATSVTTIKTHASDPKDIAASLLVAFERAGLLNAKQANQAYLDLGVPRQTSISHMDDSAIARIEVSYSHNMLDGLDNGHIAIVLKDDKWDVSAVIDGLNTINDLHNIQHTDNMITMDTKAPTNTKLVAKEVLSLLGPDNEKLIRREQIATAFKDLDLPLGIPSPSSDIGRPRA